MILNIILLCVCAFVCLLFAAQAAMLKHEIAIKDSRIAEMKNRMAWFGISEERQVRIERAKSC